jgi:CHAD domain-containing protein
MPRARTYHAPNDWTSPDFAALVPEGARLDTSETRIVTTHFDTVDHALARNGIAVLVHDDQCFVQLPDGEFSTNSPTSRAVPREVQDVLLGVRGGRRLVPVGRTDTLRRTSEIVDVDGQVAASVTDDEVIATAADGGEEVQRRREITVDAADDTLRAALDRGLKRSGAKRVRTAAKPPAENAGSPESGTIGRLLHDYLDGQRDAILAADVELRRGGDVVHAARVAMRRYRSALRVFADLFDADRATALDTELRWIAGELGAVRDAEVERARLDQAVAALDPTVVLGPVTARIDEAMLSDQVKARSRVDRVMRGRRYLALLAELESWHEAPPLTDLAAQDASASERYVRRAERTMRKRLRGFEDADDDALHRARKAAKRSRYAAELATPSLGKPAKRIAKRSKSLQTHLGHYLDTTLACRTLLQLGRATAAHTSDNGFTFGLLYQAERDRGSVARARATKLAR